MGASVNDLARELIEELGLDPVAAAESDKVHKLLYYVQGHHAAVTGEPLFLEAIEAGDGGPVVEGFGRVDLDASRGELDDVVLGTVRYVVGRYGRLSVLDLQNLTKAEPPWQAGRWLPGRRMALGDMIAYFRGGGAPFDAFEGVPVGRAADRELPVVFRQPGFPGAGETVPPQARLDEFGAAPAAGHLMTTPRTEVRRRRPWIVVGIVYAVGIGLAGLVVFGGLAVKGVVDNRDDNSTGKDAVAGQVGEPARDGDFEFIVTNVDCGRSTVGDAMRSTTARGIYCLVTLAVKNVGTRAQPFDESGQRAYDEKGERYSHDANAEFAVNAGQHAWFKEIDPGGQVSGELVFDIPKARSLTSVELHGSPVSSGVKVPLK